MGRARGTDGKSTRSVANAWGFVERFGRGGRRLHGTARASHANRRLDDSPGRLLRSRRVQADIRYGQHRRRQALCRHARHVGLVRAVGGGCGAACARFRSQRTPDSGAAACKVPSNWHVPYALLGRRSPRNAGRVPGDGPAVVRCRRRGEGNRAWDGVFESETRCNGS